MDVWILNVWILGVWILYANPGNVSITVRVGDGKLERLKKFERGPMIALLEQRLHAVASKRNGAALGLCGDPGIGKSYGTQQLLHGLSCRSASVHSTSSNSSILRALPAPTHVPVWLERGLAQVAHSSVAAQVFADTFGALLAALAPFVLHVEDLHEATTEQRDAWLQLAQQATRTRGVALIVTSRMALPAPFEAVTLEPLDLEAVTRLLEVEAGSKLPVEAINWIEASTQGNPMFTLEYFRHLSRIGSLWSDGTRWRWRAPNDQEIPTSVEAVISQHLRNVMLIPEARAGLQAKAILPLEADETLWANVAGLNPSELQIAKLELEGHGVLRAGRFAHPLYREVVLEEMLPAKRQVLARRTLERLQAHDPVVALSSLEAAALPKDKELDLLERALRQSQTGPDLAMRARITALLAEHASGTERSRLRLESVRLMREVNPVVAFEMAHKARGLDPSNLELNCVCIELLADLRRPVEAERLLNDAKPLRISNDDHNRWLLAKFEVRHHNRDYIGMIELWQDTQRLEPNLPLVAVARALALLRRANEAYEVLAEAMARSDLTNLELMELLFVRCFIPHFEGNLIESEQRLNAFLETIESLHDTNVRMAALRSEGYSLRALAHNGLDQPRAALEDELRALEYPIAMGMGSQYAEQQNYLALFLLETGDYLRAEEIIFEIRPTLERNGNAIPLSMLERFTARLYLEWGLPHGGALALWHAQAAVSLMDSAGRNAAYLGGALIVAAWAEALYGQPQKALRLIEELLEYTHGIKNPHLGIAAWLRGLSFERLERLPEAMAALQEAASSPVVLHVGPSHQRICLDLDRVTGNVNSARQRLGYFREHGMGNAEKVALRYFPQLADFPQLAQTPSNTTSTSIRLEVLGPMAINGKAISGRSKKGKELLALLLEARLNKRNEINDLELLDTLYPDLDEGAASGALRQLVYRLRSSIGADVIVRGGNGYTLGQVQTDVEAFLNGANTQLWRGPFLSDLEDPWAGSVRCTVTQALRNTLKELIEVDPTEVLRLARILLEAEPYDHAALEMGLRAARDIQDSPGANSLYASARKRFGEVGEPLPEDWTQWLEARNGR